MDRLVVALLDTLREDPDPLESSVGTARWWGALGIACENGKPRFDTALAAALRGLREAAANLACGRHTELPLAFRGDASDVILFEVAYAVRTAAADGSLRRMRLCRGRGCGRYFLDQTKNGSRRWCSLRCMERARAPRRRTIGR